VCTVGDSVVVEGDAVVMLPARRRNGSGEGT
jgi:hypothetical protein